MLSFFNTTNSGMLYELPVVTAVLETCRAQLVREGLYISAAVLPRGTTSNRSLQRLQLLVRSLLSTYQPYDYDVTLLLPEKVHQFMLLAYYYVTLVCVNNMTM